jgi:hypothetical protein
MRSGDRVYCRRLASKRRKVGTVRDVTAKTITVLWDDGECARYAMGGFSGPALHRVDWANDSTAEQSAATR